MESKICSKCKTEYEATKEYYYETKGKLIQPCKKCRNEYQTKRMYEKRDYCYAQTKEWIKNNKEHLKQYQREFNKNNPEIKAEFSKRWRKENKDKIKEYCIKRAEKNHKISNIEWNYCKMYFNNSCAYCGMTTSDSKIKYKQGLHKEHVVYDGENDISNCVPACKSCNGAKNVFPMKEWYETQTFFDENSLNKILKWMDEDYKLVTEHTK